jgi:hypothetical protein
MSASKKEFYTGVGLMAGFLAVLVVLFLPIFGGQNALNALDSLYNTISKGSAYYIPKLKKEAGDYAGKQIAVTLAMSDANTAKETEALFVKSGAAVTVAGEKLSVSGDIGKILSNCLDDADDMFHNQGEKIKAKYNCEERKVLSNWWNALKAMDKDLKKQEKFAEAKPIAMVMKKGVECSYNYYKVNPQNISDRWGIVLFSLVFYVVYTVWYGFAIMFMFEGAGFKLEH